MPVQLQMSRLLRLSNSILRIPIPVRLDSRVLGLVIDFTVRRLRKKVEHNENTRLRGD